MKYTNKTVHQLDDFEIPFAPADLNDILTCEKNGRTFIAYLAHDAHPQNPLEEFDTYGSIVSSSRHASRDTHRMMQKALGLDPYWEPDLDLVDEARVFAELQNLPLEKRLDLASCNFTRDAEESDEDFVKDALKTVEDYREADEGLVLEIERKVWEAQRQEGTIGERFAVPLDVYEHSGIAYSVSGEGMQCTFDTSRGGAVWLPTDTLKECIVSNGEVYRKGRIFKLKTKYFVEVFGASPASLPSFEDEQGAFNYLQSVEVAEEHLKPAEEGQDVAAKEFARQASRVFNAYCNGDVYGLVFLEFETETKKLISDEATWGYYGNTDAEEELQSVFNSQVA